MATNLLTTVLVSGVTSAIVGGGVVAGFVNLQDTTPGTAQTGHVNVTGYVRAGALGIGVAPTLAKVQVEETGGDQGVRARTASGVSIYGQNTATTGLGAGGYFTSNSATGRAIVGDAMSTTGNTIGGLFYNRSATGYGVMGKCIGAGSGIAVVGQTDSASGAGMAAVNFGSGNNVVAATPTDSLQISGTLPRFMYQPVQPRPIAPVAYGKVASGGAILDEGSGNWTVAHPATGVYEITVSGYTLSVSGSTITATTDEAAAFQGCTADFGSNGSDFNVRVWTDASVAVNSNFSFIVYKGVPGPTPAMPEELANPAGLNRYRSDEVWAQRDPKGHDAWLRNLGEWTRRQQIAPITVSRVN